MISQTLALETFRQNMGYHPFHFWGFANAEAAKIRSACNELLPKYAWQFGGADIAGREEVYQSFLESHARLSHLLEFSALPDFYEETVLMPEYFDRAQSRTRYVGSDGKWISVQLTKGRLLGVGPEKLTLIGESALSLQDSDNDTCIDYFVATIATTVTDPSKIAVYFKATDRLNNEGPTGKWRIEPINVVISEGQATITGKAWLVCRPILYEGLNVNSIDPSNTDNFVTSVEVYTREVNTSGQTQETAQAVLYWDTEPYPSFCCLGGGSNSDPAGVATALARVSLRDVKNGVVGVGEAVYDSSTSSWISVDFPALCRLPDRVLVRYYSGDTRTNWGTTLSRFCAAEMSRRPCACDTANRELYRWQLDLARAGSIAIEQFTISPQDLSNPVGTKAGHVYAWKQIATQRRIVGVLA